MKSRKWDTDCKDLHGSHRISGVKLNRDPEFARDFLLEFQDRLLYGRDCFDNRLQEFLNSLGLPEDVLAKIYSENALRLVPDK